MKNIKRIAAATALATGLGLAGLGAASVAEAFPGPMPDYHWCPGQFYDPAWGPNWDWNRCHDNDYFDGDAHNQGNWHGQGAWRPDNDRGPGGPGMHDYDHGGQNGQGWSDHGGQR